jgi:hypothetical protein
MTVSLFEELNSVYDMQICNVSQVYDYMMSKLKNAAKVQKHLTIAVLRDRDFRSAVYLNDLKYNHLCDIYLEEYELDALKRRVKTTDVQCRITTYCNDPKDNNYTVALFKFEWHTLKTAEIKHDVTEVKDTNV